MNLILAYLDPGSGSALVGTLIAVVGSALYSLKTLFYRLLQGGGEREVQPELAIFSEGKNYWGTWQSIVEELIVREIHFSYYTLDLKDPALRIDNVYMHSHLYDGNSQSAYRRLAQIKCKCLLSTTPNIGTPGYPLPRPRQVERLIHVFHAFADVSAYHKGSLDSYDVVLTVGAHQEAYIREVESARMVKAKKIFPVGLPYFDQMFNSLRCIHSQEARLPEVKRILIAPSWGAKSCFHVYGIDFVQQLARAGYSIVVRPHPQSYISEPHRIAAYRNATASFENVTWDDSLSGKDAMEMADLLISDTSSIRFDFAFLFGKPVLTLDIPRGNLAEYDGVYQKRLWTDLAAERIGKVLVKANVSTIVTAVDSILREARAKDVVRFRSEVIANIGHSARATVDALVVELAERDANV